MLLPMLFNCCHLVIVHAQLLVRAAEMWRRALWPGACSLRLTLCNAPQSTAMPNHSVPTEAGPSAEGAVNSHHLVSDRVTTASSLSIVLGVCVCVCVCVHTCDTGTMWFVGTE